VRVEPQGDHSVAAALRELSVCLARLSDTFDWTDHTSKHNQRTDHWVGFMMKLINTKRTRLKNRWG